MATSTKPYLIMQPEEHAVLGESEFGMPGLIAIESIGPYTGLEASGPLITVHDSVIDAGLGIGHHPHRYNERLFYIEEGQLDHDDSLNKIQGHMDAGDVGQFVEGPGMMHSEWNHGDTDTRAYILVYSTDPIPEVTAFNALRDADAPRYDEAPGVHTKELVGAKSPLRVNGDVRFFAESRLDAGAQLTLELGAMEGGLVSVREGSVRVVGDDAVLAQEATLIAPPAAEARTIRLRSEEPSRIVRVVHGPGHGFIHQAPRYQTRTKRS